jgi:diguanylate cyclase (GGDEF)-like protein/putative nucleotidyltransferase with HDIG domain
MSRRAWLYVWGILLAGAVVSGYAMAVNPVLDATDPLTLVMLIGLTILAQFLEAEAPGRQSYYPHLVFLFAGVLLLDAPFFATLVIVPHLVEWIRKRLAKSPMLRQWYIQPFNIATHLIAGFAAHWLLVTLTPGALTFITPLAVLAVTLSALTYVLINHLLIGLVLLLARGVSLRDSGVFALSNLLSDLIQLALGYVVAVVWQLNPLLIVPALSPLVMIYRALTVPQLKQEAHTDAKTGLWNARHFAQLAGVEMERAGRFNRPLSVVVADLDLLRNINNTYGHLAGDAVLTGIGRIIRETIREYDIAARFGGEEFSIVLLEAGLAEARSFAERLRAAIESAAFEISTSPKPIHATMSLGVACFPDDGATLNDLIHQADVAVYQAKLKGRNCVVCAADVPHSIRLESAPLADRLETETAYAAAYAPRPEKPRPAAPTSGRRAADKQQIESFLTPRGASRIPLPLFVGAVILLGVVAAITGIAISPPPNLAAVGLLVALAVAAELFQVTVYDLNTVSVSVTIAFASALIAGLPGVTAVSAGIALAHYLQKHPRLHRSLFNWAIHVLAGVVPVLAIRAQPVALSVANLALLGLLTLLVAPIYYLVETGLVAIAISLTQGSSLKTTWHQQFRWLANHYLVLCVLGLLLAVAFQALGLPGLIVFVLPILMMRYSQKQYVDRTEESVRELKRMNQELTLANYEIVSASQAIRQLNDELFLTLAKIIDARDPYAAGHAAQVADYAMAVAAGLGIRPDQLDHMRQAALLHDIGKLAISERVLHKPGPLTPDEYEYIKTHAPLGAEFLETCQGLRHLATFVRHHHEWWNGQGYPDALAGEQVPLESRILAVCDAAEAMASDRPYHRAMSLDEIVAELRRFSGTQFDPAVVEEFVRVAQREGRLFVVNSAREVARQQAAQPNRRNGQEIWQAPQMEYSGVA